MSGKQYEIGIRINGDGSVFVSEAGRAEKAADRFRNSIDGIEKSTQGLTSSAARMGHTLAAAMSVRELAQASDAWAHLDGRIKLVSGSLAEASVGLQSVYAIAQKAGGELGAIGDIYQKLSRNARQYNMDQAGVLLITEAVANAVKLSGASAASSQAALMQFGQALSAGQLRGEELNSVLEQTPALAEAIARGMGKTVGELKKLGEEGALTAKEVLAAIRSESARLEQEAGQMASTIGSAMQRLDNAFKRFVGTEGGGVAQAAASGINFLAANLDEAAMAATVFGAAWASLKIATWAGDVLGVVAAKRALAAAELVNAQAAVASAAAQASSKTALLGSVVATEALTAANAQLAVAQSAVSASSITGMLARFGPWALAAAAALGAGLIVWKDWRDMASLATAETESAAAAARRLATDLDKTATEVAVMTRAAYNAAVTNALVAREKIAGQAAAAQKKLDEFTGNRVSTEFNEVQTAAASARLELQRVDAGLQKLIESSNRVGSKPLDDYFDKFGSKATKAADELKKLKQATDAQLERMRVDGASAADLAAVEKNYRDKAAEIRKTLNAGANSAANDASQIFQARLATEKDYISTSVKLIAEKVRQNVLTEREGFEQTAAIQQAGYVAQAKLLKQRLAETTDKGEREKLKQQIIALGNDAQEAAEKGATGIMLIAEKELKAQQEYSHGLASETEALLQKAKAADLELGTIGLSAEKLAELTARRYDEQIAIKTAEADRLRESQGREADVHLIELQIDALTRLKSAEITKTKLQEQAREWDSFSRDIQRSLTDSLYRGLEKGGKDGAKLARDTITNSLKAIPLKLFVQAVINPVMNGAQQVLGIGGGNGAAGSVGSLASLYNAYSSWSNAGGIGGLGTAAGNWFGQAFGDAAYAANSGAYAQGFSAGLYGGQGMAAEYSKYALEMSNAGNYAAAGAYQQAADAAGKGASQGGGLSSGLGYAAAFYALTQEKYGQAVGTAIGTSIMPGIGTVIGSTLGSLVDSFTSSGGAPKSMVGGGGRITSSGVVYDPTGQAHWTDYTEQSKSLASAILTEQLVGALRKINAGYAGGGAYVKGELNLKGSSSNQTVAQATSSSGQVIYHRYTEAGKGTEDFQKFVAEEIPRLQLALVVDAMRTAGGEIQKIANSVVGSSTDLTEALAQIDASATISQLDQLASVFNLIRTNIDSRITGEATVALAKLAGGAQALSASVNAYYNNYFSQEEKAARLQQQMTEAFTRLGLVVPTTRAGFRVLVDGLDKTTSAGQETFTALMSLQDAFGQVADAAEATAKTSAEAAARKAADAESVLRESYDRYASALDATRTKFDGFAKSLLSFRQQLMFGELSTLSPYEKYQQAAKAFRDISRRSALGDEAAIEQLQSASQSFLEASRSYNASNEQYARDFAEVQAALTRTADVAQRQASIAAEQLMTLRQQVSALIDIRDGIGGLSDDLGSLANAVLSAMSDVSAARALQQQPQKPAGNSATASIVAAYQASLGRAPDASGLAYWQNQAAAGVSADTISAAIAASPEAQVNSLYQSVLGRSADASGQSYWMAQITSGVSADTVAAAMRASDEYRNSHATGLEVVPFHGYRAVLHKDEAVVDAQSVAAIRRYFGVQVSATTNNREGSTEILLSEQNQLLRDILLQNGVASSAQLLRLEAIDRRLAEVENNSSLLRAA